MPATGGGKRKRSAVACTTCHNRRVRCNVAFHGIPCTNCAQDGTVCSVYGQTPAPKTARLIRPRESTEASPVSTLGPSVSVAQESEASFRPPTNTGEPLDNIDQPQDHVNEAFAENRRQGLATPRTIIDQLPVVITSSPEDDVARESNSGKEVLVPYYSGEAGGLEFLADVCAPDRPIKGTTYIVSQKVHKRQHLSPGASHGPQSFFSAPVCDELIRCFFHFVYPFLPVINAGEFLTAYTQSVDKVSKLLLWSVFFASASYVDIHIIKLERFNSRKSFKEYCYQNAKAIYDAQLETDKTPIISSTLLLSFWYVDLEDIDGCWHWIGIASNLCHGIGLHREPNYGRLPRCPFPKSKLSLWRRLWWSCYYRDAWAALAFGRPMRLHLDDSDIALPRASDMLIDIEALPKEVRDAYLAPDLESLAKLWITLLELSVKLEDVLLLHYRPRRPPFSLIQLELDHTEISRLFDSIPQERRSSSRILTLHLNHLRCYFNAVVITLHRSYMLATPENLASAEREHLQRIAVQRSRDAAAGTTAILNQLITLNMINASPSMLMPVLTPVMQVHFHDIVRSEGLARQHASHNLNLHMMVLSYLKRTFWAADLIHNLFAEGLKATDNSKSGGMRQDHDSESTQQNPGLISSPGHTRESNVHGASTVVDSLSLSEDIFEEILVSFNPFENMQCIFDESTPSDWDLATSLDLDGV